jgi:membrane protease YdiL (CAAX protease family)
MWPESSAAGARRVPAPEVPGSAPEVPGPAPEAPPHAWPLPPPADAGEPQALGAGEPRPGTRPAPSRAAVPGEPFYLPRADWRWTAAVAGLLAGAAPQILLQLASLFAGGTPTNAAAATTSAAILIALTSLVLYSWQALAAWLFSLRTAGRSLALWGFRRPTRAYFWVVPLALGATYTLGVIHDIIVHPHQQAIINDFPRTPVGAAMFVLVAVVFAPVFEEVLFRGFLFRGLANSFGWVWGAVISAAIFGAAHVQLDVFVPLAVLGFALAWAYHRTGSLWTNITMHALFNAVAVLAWAFTK